MNDPFDDFIVETISNRAYEIHLSGINNGDELADWLEAEKSVCQSFRYLTNGSPLSMRRDTTDKKVNNGSFKRLS